MLAATAAGGSPAISMNESTMTRAGFAPYGPSGAGVEALARVMAADLEEGRAGHAQHAPAGRRDGERDDPRGGSPRSCAPACWTRQ